MPKSSIAKRMPSSFRAAEHVEVLGAGLDGHALGDLEHQQRPGKPVEAKHPLDLLDQVRVLELTTRQVDVQLERGRHLALGSPVGRLPARHLQDGHADLADHAGLLGQLDERVGADQAAMRVVPAQQGLEGHDPAGDQVDDRLVVAEELVLVERLAQVLAQLEPLDGGRPASSARTPGTWTCPTPLAAYSATSASDSRSAPAWPDVAVGDGHAHAGPGEDLPAVEREGHVERLQDPTGHVRGVLGPFHLLEQDAELVAAESGHGVARPHAAAESSGHRCEQPVAGRVAEAVVDGLEVVEVDEEHRG